MRPDISFNSAVFDLFDQDFALVVAGVIADGVNFGGGVSSGL